MDMRDIVLGVAAWVKIGQSASPDLPLQRQV
jgi:hypothetical protein